MHSVFIKVHQRSLDPAPNTMEITVLTENKHTVILFKYMYLLFIKLCQKALFPLPMQLPLSLPLAILLRNASNTTEIIVLTENNNIHILFQFVHLALMIKGLGG